MRQNVENWTRGYLQKYVYIHALALSRLRTNMLHRTPTNLIRLTLSSQSPHVGGPSWKLLSETSNQSRVPPKPINNPIGWSGSSEALRYFKVCKYLSHMRPKWGRCVTCDAS